MELCESLLQRRRLGSASRLSLRQTEEIGEVARLLFVAHGPHRPPVEHPCGSIIVGPSPSKAFALATLLTSPTLELPRRSTRQREVGPCRYFLLAELFLDVAVAWICSFLPAADEQQLRLVRKMRLATGVMEAAAVAAMELLWRRVWALGRTT
jgi:hypothetical protein